MEQILEIENAAPIKSPTAADVERAVASIDLKGPAFCILTHTDGSYVQTAGSKVGLLVEYRNVNGNSFTHYVIGTRSPDTAPTSVRYKHGSLQLRRNEIMLVSEAREIFVWFLAMGQIDPKWNLRDITENFG